MATSDPWESTLVAFVNNMIPTLDRVNPDTERFLPKTPNVVTTVYLLHKGFQLPLHCIARRFPNAQFAPNLFAAVRFALRDNLSQAMALLFSPGSLVVVGSRSRQQALYWSRVVAVMISSTRFPIYNVQTNQLETHILGTFMQFSNFMTHNHVGNGDLGHNLDLNAINEAYSLRSSHDEGLFPGLTCQVWLTKNYKCNCPKSRDSCKCMLSVTLFKTGKVVIPGCRTIEDMNCAFYRVRMAVARFKEGSQVRESTPSSLPDGAVQRKRAKKDTDDGEAPIYKPQTVSAIRKTTMAPILRFALDDRLAEVARLLELMPNCVTSDIVDRFKSIQPTERMPNYDEIFKALKNAEGAVAREEISL